MRKRRLLGYSGLALFGVFIIGAIVSISPVLAETSSSTHYQMTETELGSGSSQQGCSSQYCASSSLGEVGSPNSATSAATGKANYSEPILEMTVTSGSSDMGTLTTERTATKTMTVKISNYMSEGYILQIVGDPPKYNGHTLTTPSVQTASQVGTEQFGINAVANTSPSVGADPVQDPTGQGVFGAADPAYATPNMFKYTSGDTVARSSQTMGSTTYTITMIANVSGITPSGRYSGDFAAVVIPTY